MAIVDGSGTQITSFGGGTQYTEADVDTTITGTAVMWEDTSDTLRAVSASKPLPVNIISGGAGDGAILDGVSSAIKATVLDLTSANPLTVAITDGNGDQITSFGGGTQYTEGDTDASITGTAMLMEVGSDTLQPVQGTVAAGLLVNLGTNNDVTVTGTVDLGATDNAVLDAIAASVAAIDTDATTIIGHVDGIEGILTTMDADTGNIVTSVQLIDDTVATLGTTTYTETTTKGLVIGAVRRDADTTLVDTTNEVGPLQMNAAGQLKVEVFSGETLPVSLTSTTVTGTVAVTQSGTWDEVGINDSGNSITVDYATTGSGTATGALRVELPTNGTGVIATVGAVTAITNALPAGTNAIGKLAANSGVDIGDTDVTSVIAGTGATNLGKAEDAGHTTGDTGVYSLGVRNDTPNTALTNTDADYASITTDRVGGIRTALYETDFAVLGTNHVKKYYTNSGAVTDGIVWSPAAGKRWYVTDLIINVSAAATVTFEDDLAGGDSAIMKFELAANSGLSHSFTTPWFSGEDAADLIVTTSAGNVYITVTGYEI